MQIILVKYQRDNKLRLWNLTEWVQIWHPPHHTPNWEKFLHQTLMFLYILHAEIPTVLLLFVPNYLFKGICPEAHDSSPITTHTTYADISYSSYILWELGLGELAQTLMLCLLTLL